MTSERRGSLPGLFATALGFTGLAIAAPLFIVLGASETFFTAHGAGRLGVIGFALAILVVPAVLTFGVLVAIRTIAPGALATVVDLFVGLMAAFVIVSTIDRGLSLRTRWYALLLIAISVGATLAHRRLAEVRMFSRLVAIGPVALAAWFLLFSSAASLVLPRSGIAEARAASDADVVFVVFDEFPLAALLDDDGSLNEQRFPAFGRLADDSTWYRRATTVAPWTNLAVPALLSGKMPIFPATADHYAQNVFSMLEPTHDLEVMEVVTRMCQATACPSGTDVALLAEDTSIVYGHTVLPDGIAGRLLPSIEGRWANFRGRDDLSVAPDRGVRSETNRFERFIDTVDAHDAQRPTAQIAHILLPHFPLSYLPDGRIYDTRPEPAGMTSGDGPGLQWLPDQATRDIGRQRFLLQVRYVDMMLGRLLDTLRSQDRYEDTMLVLAADHGVSFEPGNKRGAPYRDVTAPDALPVPMFVKYPGQTEGEVVDRPVQTIDVVPTIADGLDVDLPESWTFDGRSMRDADTPRPNRYFDGGPAAQPPDIVDVEGAAAKYISLFGSWRGEHDTYAWGPHADLVGTPLDAEAADGGGATLIDDRVLGYDGDEPVPALVELAFDEPPPHAWFAVAIDGTIAGLGRTYERDGRPAGAAMIDPSFLERDNQLAGAFLTDDGGRVPFEIGRG